MEKHKLRGRLKRFWFFMSVTALVSFLANIITQFLLNGEVDITRAITLSLTLGIVLAILFSYRRMGCR